jgi:hypothetical protein
MNRDFTYELKKILKSPPVEHPGNFDGIFFRYDYNTKQEAMGVQLTVKSNTTADINGLKLFLSTSEYFIPYEQPTPGQISNDILAELIYQHLSRETDTVFNVSRGQTILQPPTLKNILNSLVVQEN